MMGFTAPQGSTLITLMDTSPCPGKKRECHSVGQFWAVLGYSNSCRSQMCICLYQASFTIIFCHEEIQVYMAQSVGVVMSIPHSSTSFLSTWYSPAPVHIHTTHTVFFPVLKVNQRTEQDQASPSTTHRFVRTSPFVLEVHQMLWQPLFLSTHFYN